MNARIIYHESIMSFFTLAKLSVNQNSFICASGHEINVRFTCRNTFFGHARHYRRRNVLLRGATKFVITSRTYINWNFEAEKVQWKADPAKSVPICMSSVRNEAKRTYLYTRFNFKVNREIILYNVVKSLRFTKSWVIIRHFFRFQFSSAEHFSIVLYTNEHKEHVPKEHNILDRKDCFQSEQGYTTMLKCRCRWQAPYLIHWMRLPAARQNTPCNRNYRTQTSD